MSAVVIPSTVSSMYEITTALLDAIVAAMATTAAGAPDRSFISLGAPAFETDCAQAAVQVLTLTEEQTGPLSPSAQTGQRFKRGRMNLVGLVGYAMRCVEVSEGNLNVYASPFDATLSAAAKAGYDDGWAIWNWVRAGVADGTLFGGRCSVVHFDGGIPAAPQGGLGGWQFSLRVELPGYVPAGA